MKRSEDLLQERLERLEAGEPLEACLAGLPGDMADLIQLVAALGEAPYPQRNDRVVAAQRARLLRLAEKENNMKAQSSQGAQNVSILSLRNWLRPLPALAGITALLFVCALVTVVGIGIAQWTSRDTQVAQGPALDSSPETLAQSFVSPLALESSYTLFMPMVASPGNPQRATLQDIRGLVQVQAGDGRWTTVGSNHSIAARQRVRTGELSSARLMFFDGSQTHLGPNTEISVSELDARVSDGPRTIVLTQWAGQTYHDVAPAQHYNSRYAVHTPSATATARGTSFQVRVTPDLLTHFSVDEGTVAVTNVNVTVVVLPGQLTTVDPNQAPGKPAFRITGEGQVSQIGPTWTVAGQTFETHDHTVIVGNPQVGDWVFVQGRLGPDGVRLADRILLLRRAPTERFAITGPAQEIGDDAWTVAGQALTVDDKTDVEEGIETGDRVRVAGIILPDGTFLAEQIRLIEDEPGLPFEFVGVVGEIINETWTISGVTVAIDAETEIKVGLAVGDVVRVRGQIQDDGRWLARSIEGIEEEEPEFSFTGRVEHIAPWNVAGISFETHEWTEVEPGIDVGDRVRVTGRIQDDGTWVADEIEQFDDEDDDDDDEDECHARHIVFKGRLTSIDPWVVNGVPLIVTDETRIQGDVAVGDLVKVKARVLFNRIWIAQKIRRIKTDFSLGCYNVSVNVVSVGANQIVLRDWPTVDLDGVSVEGEIKVNSIITISICVNRDGTVSIVNVVVIYQPPPVIAPPPPPPQQPPPPKPPRRHRRDDDDDDDDDDD